MQDIAEGSVLLRLPRTATIAACETDECTWMPPAAQESSPVLRVALALLREQSRPDGSEWAPYLSSLPCSYNTLEQWTPSELAALRGTRVYDQLAGLREPSSGELVDAARVMWRKSVAPITEEAPHLWPDATLESFLSACAAVRSRGFYDDAEGGGGPYMLPAIDLLNHSRRGTATSLTVERDVPEIPGGGGEGGLVFSMVAERDITQGEELTHSYDDLDDAQLLLTYGFVSIEGEDALPASARIPLSLLIAGCGAVRDRQRAMLAASSRRHKEKKKRKQEKAFVASWDLGDAWEAKEAACTRLLQPHGGQVAVSVEDALPDELATVMQLMLMPAEDFESLLQDDSDDEDEADEPDGGDAKEEEADANATKERSAGAVEAAEGKLREVGARAATSGEASASAAVDAAAAPEAAASERRPPLLDTSPLDDEPEFAAVVVEALMKAVELAEARYEGAVQAAAPSVEAATGSNADSSSDSPSKFHAQRLAAAAVLRGGELRALRATKRAALQLLYESCGD